jgi:Mn2+/Fe2+ NRAMP family transporter
MIAQTLCARCIHGTRKNHGCDLRTAYGSWTSALHWHKCSRFVKAEVSEVVAHQ